MDDLDRQLISLLRSNARSTVAALAKALQVARGTVQNRIAALMTIEVEGNHLEKVVRTLRGDPEVHTLHTTNGRWDLIAEVGVDSVEALDQAISRIRRIEGIVRTETSLLLSTHKL